jgi:hypothetical protein
MHRMPCRPRFLLTNESITAKHAAPGFGQGQPGTSSITVTTQCARSSAPQTMAPRWQGLPVSQVTPSTQTDGADRISIGPHAGRKAHADRHAATVCEAHQRRRSCASLGNCSCVALPPASLQSCARGISASLHVIACTRHGFTRALLGLRPNRTLVLACAEDPLLIRQILAHVQRREALAGGLAARGPPTVSRMRPDVTWTEWVARPRWCSAGCWFLGGQQPGQSAQPSRRYWPE